MCRVQAVWSGFLGGPGVNTFYVIGDDVDPGGFQAFYEDIANGIPDEASVLVENGGVVIDDTDGELVGGWSHSPQTPTAGTGASSYAAGSGGVLRLDTGAFRRGRRVLGRAFLVPLVSDAFSGDGRIATAFAAQVVTAGEALLAAYPSELVVWHRPKDPDDGEGIPVANVAVPLRAALLATRRD